ncbi:hypothetical protein MRX96_041170 [Rhipicephalus microplus]
MPLAPNHWKKLSLVPELKQLIYIGSSPLAAFSALPVGVLLARQTTPGCLEGSRLRQQASQAAEENGPLKLIFAGNTPRNRLPDQQGRQTMVNFVFVHAFVLPTAEPVRLREGENRYLTERLESGRSQDS